MHSRGYTWIIRVALFPVAETWKQCKHASPGEWVNNTVKSYKIKSVAFKTNEL